MLKLVCLDRFAQGLPDRQEAPVRAHCAACGGEVYDTALVYVMPDGDIVHGDESCLVDYTGARLMSVEDAVGVLAWQSTD